MSDNQIPCKTCLTYTMCRQRLLNEYEYNIKQTTKHQPLAVFMAMCDSQLDKCPILKDFIRSYDGPDLKLIIKEFKL